MKLLKITLLCLILVMVATPALALGPLDASAGLSLNSKYVWRGITVNPDMVLQPDVSASFMGFGFGLWGNIDTNDINGNEWEFNEIDYTLSYDISLPMFSLGAGLIYYDFPNTEFDATTELYVTASAGVMFSPTVTIYQDLDQIKGAYWALGVSHSAPVSPALNLELAAGLGLGSKGYLAGYFGAIPDPEDSNSVSDFTGASMSDFYFSAALPIGHFPFVTITPSLTYTSLLGDAKDSAAGYGGDEDAFFYGLNASVSF